MHIKDNKKVLEGNCSTSSDGLCDIPIKINPVHKLASPTKLTTSKSNSPINIILRTDKKSTNLAMYHHGTLFSPTADTFVKSINKNFFLGWPGLTSHLITKHLLPSTSTNAGHTKQAKYSLQSTKIISITAAATNISNNTDHFPPFDSSYIKNHNVCYSLFPTTEKHFMDMTGRFLYKSSQGNE